ncbi:unnamed protein product [Linum trigynum]|uniref:Uncharacterized protein n=1 Tax=Linum trigynum TaxID=586398 RepID=A0AAV2GJ06_9ROSI
MEDAIETDLLKAADAARAALSDEYKVTDEAKYNKLLRDTVEAIRRWFRRERPEVVWDPNTIWDAVEYWSDDDINSEHVAIPTAAAP